VRPQQDGGTPALYLEKRQVRTAQRRQAVKERSTREGNLRAAVEATVRPVKHPFRHGKLLVLGRFRVACQMLGSALMVNLRRIHQHGTRSQAVARAQRQQITAPIVSAITTSAQNHPICPCSPENSPFWRCALLSQRPVRLSEHFSLTSPAPHSLSPNDLYSLKSFCQALKRGYLNKTWQFSVDYILCYMDDSI